MDSSSTIRHQRPGSEPRCWDFSARQATIVDELGVAADTVPTGVARPEARLLTERLEGYRVQAGEPRAAWTRQAGHARREARRVTKKKRP